MAPRPNNTCICSWNRSPPEFLARATDVHQQLVVPSILKYLLRMLTVLKCRSESVILACSNDTSTLSLVNPSSHRPQISFTFLSIKLVIPTAVLVWCTTS